MTFIQLFAAITVGEGIAITFDIVILMMLLRMIRGLNK